MTTAPHNGHVEEEHENPDDNRVRLKRSISLMNGVTIIVGCIIGSGIFVSPKGVHEHAGSIGLSLSIWIFCGVFAAVGSYCYAELGTLIRSSGGDYAYITQAFGPFIGFMRLWIEAIVVRPCSATIVALTFAKYVLQPFYGYCAIPAHSEALLAACALFILTLVNCASVRLAAKVQDFFTVAKLLALLLIIGTGAYEMITGSVENFNRPFLGSSKDAGQISLALYSGLFAYNGWNYLNFIVEELKDPKRNLPLAIGLSCGIVTVVYVLTNVAFYAVINPDEFVDSDATAIVFAEKVYKGYSWVMPIFVACSTIGSANGVILTASRLFFVGAREGQMPKVLTLINVNRITPIPAVLFTGFLSCLYLILSNNIYSLINYIQIVYWLAIGTAILAFFRLRCTMPDAPRPIKVNLFFPIIFFAGCVFLVIVPVIAAPVDTMIGIAIMLSSIPVYFIFVRWSNKPAWINNALDRFTLSMQKLFLVVPEEGHEE